MLETKNLCKTYLNKGKTTAALKNISLSFPSTSLIVLSGQSGSGKTTLLNILGGMDFPSDGSCSFRGAEIKRRLVDSYRKENIGFVFQDYNLINDASIKNNLRMAFEIDGKKPNDDIMTEYLKLVGLPDENESLEELFLKKPNELSGGQRQRVAIARALIKNPSILLLDEQTGSLDKKNSINLLNLLKQLSKSRLVILSTHDIDVAKPYADRIISLKNGEVIGDETIHVSQEKINSVRAGKEKQSPLYSFLCSLKTALRGLLKNPVRLISSVLLSCLTCGAFGVALSLNAADEGKVAIRTQYEQSNKAFFFVNSSMESASNGISQQECGFSSEQKKLLSNYNGGNDPIYLCKSGVSYERSSVIGRSAKNHCNPFARFLYTSYDYVMEIDEQSNKANNVLSRSDLLSDQTMCRLPETYEEIAITDMQAHYLFKYGGYDTETKEKVYFDSMDSLIGFKIDGLAITGVFKTEEDINYWLPMDVFKGYEQVYDYETNEMRLAAGFSPAKYLIAKPGFARERGKNPSMAMLRLSGNIDKDLSLRSSLSYDVNDTNYFCYYTGRYTGFTNKINVISEFARVVIFGVITCFVIIGMILSLNFFHTNIKEMERELGIMKALGAKNSSTISTVFTQGSIIAAIEFILSLIVCLIGNLIFNLKLSISILELSAIPIFGMLALIVLTMLIVSSFSSLKALTKKPIDIIENK